MSSQATFSYLPSHQLAQPLEVKIGSLELAPVKPPLSSEIFADPTKAFIGANTKSAFEFFVTVQLWSDNKCLWPEAQTRYKYNATSKVSWEQQLKFCDIASLPRNSQLVLTVWDVKAPREKYAFAGTTIAVYDSAGALKKGRQKLLLHKGVKGDPSMDTRTPSTSDEVTEHDRLEELVKAHSAGLIPAVEWLDNLTFRRLEKVLNTPIKSQNDYLILEFPRFEFPVLFTNPEYKYTIKPDTKIHYNTMVMVYDPEANNRNPTETKHRILVRSHRNGPMDSELKPSPKVRDRLRDLVATPVSFDLSDEDKDDLWRFRYHLTRIPAALPKFLRSVVWTDTVESAQAVSLLSKWSTISVDSALELLGPTFENPEVRQFAVWRLRAAEDIEIILYLLQLVQALRYEPEDSSLSDFLVTKSGENERLGTQFFWYLTVESSDAEAPIIFAKTKTKFLSSIGSQQKKSLVKQEQWVKELITLAESIKASKEARPKKIEKLRSWATDRRSISDRVPFPLDPTLEITGLRADKCSVFKSSLFPLRLSLVTSPSQNQVVQVQRHESETGAGADVDQREAVISQINPGSFEVIFKSGDDLRQDQLVIQIITLFNDLLLRENLDLKLTPYRILATTPTSGFVEFIESAPLASILSEYGSLASYLGATSTRKVEESVMDTYVRSCAGYCVITYLLGVGDRHLDNLLLTKSGHFFHADFGFILGRDPKPFAPALKLVKEMVDVMNSNSPSHDAGLWYSKFKSYCFTAFSALRKNYSLVLNLFSLMVDANIPDIRIEPTRAVAKITERFCLQMDEEQSMRFFEDLLIESVSSLFPVLIDRVHNIAQYLRA